MKKFGMLLVAAVLLISCGGIESEAKKQLRESLKHDAVVPESVKISDEEVVFKNDTLCVIDFVVRETKESGPVREKKEYIYAKLYDGVYEHCYYRNDDPFDKRMKQEVGLLNDFFKSLGDNNQVTVEEHISTKSKVGRKVK